MFRGGSLTSVLVNGSGTAFEAGSPRDVLRIFGMNYAHNGDDYSMYAVSADGNGSSRFRARPATPAPMQ